MLYIFAGFPRCGLNAGGLQYAIETVEGLAILEHGAVQYRREGRFILGEDGEEWAGPYDYWMSPSLTSAGLTWRWFPENWCFGNGVTVHKTTASYAYDQIGRILPTEGFIDYTARWEPGACPMEDHIVHLTWLTTAHRLPEFALDRIRALVEDGGCEIDHPEQYLPERHLSESRGWDGKPAMVGRLPGL